MSGHSATLPPASGPHLATESAIGVYVLFPYKGSRVILDAPHCNKPSSCWVHNSVSPVPVEVQS
jgi:hypothetical protein